nr:hypothetical protein [Tanacetum cinerariifolium]
MLVTQGEVSGTPTEPYHTPSSKAQQSPHTAPSSPSQPTETIPTSTPTEIPHLGNTPRELHGLISPKLFPLLLMSLHLSQEITVKERKQIEMDTKIAAQDLEISNLKARIKLLEDEDKGTAELSGDDAPIKGRSLETGEEAGVEKSTKRGSNDTEELINVLTSLDATNILTSGVQAVSVPLAAEVSNVGVPIGSGLVPTASPIFTTASVVILYSRRKGKEKMVESDTPKKKRLQEQIVVQMAREMEEEMARDAQRMNEQIARDVEIARIHVEEELQMLIDGLDRNNEVIAKHLHEYDQSAVDLTIGEKTELINELVKYQDHHAKILKYQAQQSKPLSKREQREFYILCTHSFKRRRRKSKRKGLRLEQDSAKKLKTSEEVSEEDLKEMMQLVHVEEVYVESLKVKHPIIDWEIYTEGKRDYWKITKLGGHTAVYQFFVDMLKQFDREDLNQLWVLVKETLSIRQASNFAPMSSKEEGERMKSKGVKLDQGSAKKMKTSKDVSKEDLKGMMQLVPLEEVLLENHQLGGHTAVYQFFVDMLKQFDREDLHELWALVKETLSIRQATKDKEKELWEELKRLFEPDFEAQLWTHNQNLMKIHWTGNYMIHVVFTMCLPKIKRFLLMKIPLLEYFATVSAKEFLLLSCSVSPSKEFALLDEDKDYSQSKTHYSQSKMYVSYSWNVSCD